MGIQAADESKDFSRVVQDRNPRGLCVFVADKNITMTTPSQFEWEFLKENEGVVAQIERNCAGWVLPKLIKWWKVRARLAYEQGVKNENEAWLEHKRCQMCGKEKVAEMASDTCKECFEDG